MTKISKTWPDNLPTLPVRAGHSLRRALRNGIDLYHRPQHLFRLQVILEKDMGCFSVTNTRYIIDRIKWSLKFERKRGRDGCWTYSINRHMALIMALYGEYENLRKAA